LDQLKSPAPISNSRCRVILDQKSMIETGESP